MSGKGNPFRRQSKQPQAQSVESTDEEKKSFHDAVVSVTAEQQERRPSKVVKHVRIQSPPPLSPDPASPVAYDDAVEKFADERHSGSPPPDSPQAANLPAAALLRDPFSPPTPQDEEHHTPEVLDNTRRNYEITSPPTSSTTQMPSVSGGAPNPFARTLAHIEPQDPTTSRNTEEIVAEGSKDSDKMTKSGAGSMDVESFTQLLLTGKTRKQDQGDESVGGATNAVNGDINADGSPTSHRADSALTRNGRRGQSSEINSSENKTEPFPQMAGATTSKKAKPPPPKPRNSKATPVERKQAPQTVSFSDFDDTGAPESAPVADRNPFSPVLESADRERNERDDVQKPRTIENPKPRAPPPVPATRRTNAKGTTTSTTKSTPADVDTPPESPGIPSPSGEDSSKYTRPVPPPKRRSGANFPDNFGITESTGNGSTAGTPNRETSPMDTASVKRSLTAPPANSSRSSSLSERNAPPPPPPTRRTRVSSRGSLEGQPNGSPSGEPKRMSADMRRTSGLSQVSEVNFNATEDESNRGVPSRDVLADLSAFQAEVDALRISTPKNSAK